MALVEPRFRGLYGTLFSIFVLFGTSMTVIGATLPRILSDFGWSYATAGAVIGAGAVGYFVSTYLAGFAIAWVGAKTAILFGLILDIAGLATFALTSSAPLNFFLYLAIGLGQGFIELTINWATLRMEKDGSGRAMNLMHGAFAIGAFAGPFIIGLLLKASLSWSLVYRGMAILFVVVAVIGLTLPFEELGNESSQETKAGGRALYKRGAFWLGFIALLLYVGVELGVSNWVAEYFVVVFGAEAAQGSFMVSLFWAGLLLGRFGVPVVFRKTRRELPLLASASLMAISVVSLAIIGALVRTPSVLTFSVAAVLVAMAGLGCSVVYPITVTIVGGIFPRAQSQAIAFASTGGGIGSFAFPFLMANLAALFGIRVGFASYGFFAILVTLCSFMLVRVARRAGADRATR